MSVIQKQNFLAKMENVYQFCGNAILTMIVVMTVTNLHIFAGIKIVPVVGGVVLDMPIIDVFPNGYFVMAKMIVEMLPMN